MDVEAFSRIEQLIQQDPGCRGLLSADFPFHAHSNGQLQGAATDLARSARTVAIVTGFFIPDAEPPAAETDGPPGAIVIARALREIGARPILVTDSPCANALRVAADFAGLEPNTVEICPHSATDPTLALRWMNRFVHEQTVPGLSHLIAIERVGPTLRGGCYNMRGLLLDEFSAPLHRLFETPGREFRTIGIGDGGNEIGMGAIPWDTIEHQSPHSGLLRTACRTPVDWNIIAGTSNWGGFALAAAVLSLRKAEHALLRMDARFHREMLERMVRDGPAVDGVTRRPEPTVDGLPFSNYFEIWTQIGQVCRQNQ